jgi:hypothetical protein
MPIHLCATLRLIGEIDDAQDVRRNQTCGGRFHPFNSAPGRGKANASGAMLVRAMLNKRECHARAWVRIRAGGWLSIGSPRLCSMTGLHSRQRGPLHARSHSISAGAASVRIEARTLQPRFSRHWNLARLHDAKSRRKGFFPARSSTVAASHTHNPSSASND